MYCTKPDVRARYEENIRSMPGPDVANIWYWSNRCRSYSRWNLFNGGTHTFAAPLGDGTGRDEIDGNDTNNQRTDDHRCRVVPIVMLKGVVEALSSADH